MLIFSKRVLGLGGQAGTRHHALLTSFLLCFGGGVLLATTMVKIFQKLENISADSLGEEDCAGKWPSALGNTVFLLWNDFRCDGTIHALCQTQK